MKKIFPNPWKLHPLEDHKVYSMNNTSPTYLSFKSYFRFQYCKFPQFSFLTEKRNEAATVVYHCTGRMYVYWLPDRLNVLQIHMEASLPKPTLQFYKEGYLSLSSMFQCQKSRYQLQCVTLKWLELVNQGSHVKVYAVIVLVYVSVIFFSDRWHNAETKQHMKDNALQL